jgi:hypothetical protein
MGIPLGSEPMIGTPLARAIGRATLSSSQHGEGSIRDRNAALSGNFLMASPNCGGEILVAIANHSSQVKSAVELG